MLIVYFSFLVERENIIFFPSLSWCLWGSPPEKGEHSFFVSLLPHATPRLLLNIQKITIFHLLVFIRNFHRLRPRQSFFGWFFSLCVVPMKNGPQSRLSHPAILENNSSLLFFRLKPFGCCHGHSFAKNVDLQKMFRLKNEQIPEII